MKSKNLLKNTFVTVALVFENTTTDLEEIIENVFSKLKKSTDYFEILIVDNHIGWKSGLLENICLKYPNIRCVLLSRYNSREVFYNVILENSLGDCIVIFDPLTYSVDIIDVLTNTVLEGQDMVLIGTKKEVGKNIIDEIIISVMRFVFKKVLKIDFRPQRVFNGSLARSAANLILKVKNKRKFLRYSDYFVGLNMKTIFFPTIKGSKKYKINSKDVILSGLDVLITNSQLPLRLASLFGLMASLLSFSFLVYVFIISLVKKRIIEGWITTSIVTGSLFFVMFLILTILSEYVSRILFEIKDEPLYFVSKEIISSTDKKKGKKQINVVKK